MAILGVRIEYAFILGQNFSQTVSLVFRIFGPFWFGVASLGFVKFLPQPNTDVHLFFIEVGAWNLVHVAAVTLPKGEKMAYFLQVRLTRTENRESKGANNVQFHYRSGFQWFLFLCFEIYRPQ